MPSTEALLAVALVAVYLVDSTLFLCVGEAVVLTRGRSVRALSFGWAFELGGRRPYTPNPLMPFRPEFRVEWDTSGGTTADVRLVSEQMRRHLEAIRPVGWIATVCAIAIVLIAPAALALGNQLVFLASAATSALAAVAGCVLVALRKTELGLSTRQVCSLVFVALVCLPCSPNLARAVTLQRKWTLAARDLPHMGFESAVTEQTQGQVLAELASARRYVGEESAQLRIIDEQIRQLGGGVP